MPSINIDMGVVLNLLKVAPHFSDQIDGGVVDLLESFLLVLRSIFSIENSKRKSNSHSIEKRYSHKEI